MSGLPPAADRWIRFTVAGEDHAIDIRAAREVMRGVVPEPEPGAPPVVLGVINLRGQIVTVLDFARWLGREPAGRTSLLLVLDHGGTVLALTIDAVHEVLRLEPGDIAPAVSDERLFAGLATRATGPLTLLDADALAACFAA